MRRMLFGELLQCAHNLDIDKTAIYQFVTAMPMSFVSTTHHGKGVDKKNGRGVLTSVLFVWEI